jgi:uncharacterized protein
MERRYDMLQESPYNVKVFHEDNVLLLNTMNLAYVRLPVRLFKNACDVVELVNHGADIHNIGIDIRSTAFMLRESGFFTSDPEEQRQEVVRRFEYSRQNREHLSFTIAPTHACNFGCSYCYENSNNEFMSPETAAAIAEFLEQKITSKRFRSMHVTWYGGEPLLSRALLVVNFLSERIIAACDNHAVAYNANIITNGYNLTPDVARQLASVRIRLAQITLDGTLEMHDARRHLLDGRKTFEQIINNLVDCRKYLRYSLRVNVDPENASSIPALKQFLREKGILDGTDHTSLYIAPVRTYTAGCTNRSCMSNSDFYALELNLLQNGINDKYGEVIEAFPQLKDSVCTAVAEDSFTIGPDGNLYKCWLDIGRDERCVGKIAEETTFNNLLVDWTSYNPVDSEKCSTCTMLPVCMGGCPALNLMSRGCTENQACCSWKYRLPETLIATASSTTYS